LGSHQKPATHQVVPNIIFAHLFTIDASGDQNGLRSCSPGYLTSSKVDRTGREGSGREGRLGYCVAWRLRQDAFAGELRKRTAGCERKLAKELYCVFDSAAQLLMGLSEDTPMRIAASDGDPDLARCDAHLSADAEQL
jgi:hypothetical protein